MRRYPKKSNSSRNTIIALIVVILAVLLSIIINIALRPIVFDMANQAGKYAVYEAINETVTDIFSEKNIPYSQLANLIYNDLGYVSAVEYNYSSVNSIKIQCAKQLTSSLDKLRASKISVPIGSLFGDINTQGRGLKLRFRFAQKSVPDVHIVSIFESAGINQTKHEIRLIVSVDAEVYIPPEKSQFTCKQEYILASTIIVGDIPSGYAAIK